MKWKMKKKCNETTTHTYIHKTYTIVTVAVDTWIAQFFSVSSTMCRFNCYCFVLSFAQTFLSLHNPKVNFYSIIETKWISTIRNETKITFDFKICNWATLYTKAHMRFLSTEMNISWDFFSIPRIHLGFFEKSHNRKSYLFIWICCCGCMYLETVVRVMIKFR